MKKVLALMLAAMMVLGTIAVATAEENNVVSIYYGGGTPLSIDPALNSASIGSNTIRLAFSGLMGTQIVDGKPVLMPELAEGYTLSDDKLTYTFTLREGLKWSDGSDLLASDFKKSWDRASSEELGADYGYMFGYVDGYNDGKGPLNVQADDAARTITVKVVAPSPFFLELVAFPTYFPVKTDIADVQGAWSTKPETYIGTGPFRMTKYAVDDVIAFEKNPYYWNAEKVSLNGVNCLISEDNVAMLTAYENDSACYIDQSIDPAEFERLKSTYPGEFGIADMFGTWYILFNVHKDVSPTGKQLTVQEQSKARFALGQLVNRQDLVDYVTQAGQVPAKGFFPAGLSDGLNADVRTAEGYDSWYTGTSTPSKENASYTEDQVAAIKTLIDLGYAYTGTVEAGDIKFTDFPTIEFAFNPSGANTAIIQYVQEGWNQVGITGMVNTEAWATLQTKLKTGDAEAARMGWVADFNHTLNFLEIFISDSGNNYPRLGKDLGDYTRNSDVTKDAGMGAYWGLNGDQTWADAFDKLVDEVRMAATPEEAAAKSAEAEKVLMATGGVAPMYFYTKPFILKPYVKGLVQLASGDVVWNYVTIEK